MDHRSQRSCTMWKALFKKWKKSKYSVKKRDLLTTVMSYKTKWSLKQSGGEACQDRFLYHKTEATRLQVPDGDVCFAKGTLKASPLSVSTPTIQTTSCDLIPSEIYTQELLRHNYGLLLDSDIMTPDLIQDEDDGDQRMDWSSSLASSGGSDGTALNSNRGGFYRLVRRISLCSRVSRLDNRRKKMLNMSASTSTLTSSPSVEEMDQTTYNDTFFRQEGKTGQEHSNDREADVTSSSEDDVIRNACSKMEVLDKILYGLPASRTTTSINVTRSPLINRRSVFRSFKDLFSMTQKFEKTPKRGLYLGAVVISREECLLTHQNAIPLLLIDENFSHTTLRLDFHWLMKVSCCWESAKDLATNIGDLCESSEAIKSRCKMLSTIFLLQETVGMSDLGHLHLEPIFYASTESVVLLTVKHLGGHETLNSNQLRWTPLYKIQNSIRIQKLVISSSSSDLSSSTCSGSSMFETDGIESLTSDLINITVKPGIGEYFNPLGRGLYVGYLKLRCSVESINIFVHRSLPTMIPQIKVKDCPIVTRAEWEWILGLAEGNFSKVASADEMTFQRLLSSACVRLFEDLGVRDYGKHRLYNVQVIHLSDDVSFIILMPPVEQACLLPGQVECEAVPTLLNCIDIPINVFEIINTKTYWRELARRYGRLSAALELNLVHAQQATRQAFMTEELFFSKQQLHRLEKVQRNLEKVWKGVRWIPRVIRFARNKGRDGGLTVEKLFSTGR